MKITQNYQKDWTFGADSHHYGRILKKFENNPWIFCITAFNYTVLSTHVPNIIWQAVQKISSFFFDNILIT